MLHILTYDSHRSQVLFRLYRRNLSHLDFLGKLFIQHFTSQVGIRIAHTDRRGVLRRSLRHKEHADTILRQRLEDAVVHTNHTYHTKTLHGNQARIVNGRNTLNRFGLRVGNFLFDNRSRSFGIKCILY